MKPMIQVIENFLKKRRQPRQGAVRVELSDQGFRIWRDNSRMEEIAWTEIERIATYKVDCFAYDNIQLVFETQDEGGAFQISEEVEGFDSLMGVMNSAFPDIDPEWYLKVTLPAFVENFAILFERKH